MIDLHAHLLPGLDDGARTLEQSVEMARSMAVDGTRIVAATPHVRDDFPTTPEAMTGALRDVRAAVSDAGIALDIRGGGEIDLRQLERLAADDLMRFGLGGNPRLLLIEYPYYGRPLTLALECERLTRLGIVAVIAHPERNASLQERPADLEGAVNAGAVVQLTAASLDGRSGRSAARCARRLLELELAHLVASDAHSPEVRSAGMSAAVASLGDSALARWLTTSVPEALLASEDLPPRPAGARRPRRLLARMRR